MSIFMSQKCICFLKVKSSLVAFVFCITIGFFMVVYLNSAHKSSNDYLKLDCLLIIFNLRARFYYGRGNFSKFRGVFREIVSSSNT